MEKGVKKRLKLTRRDIQIFLELDKFGCVSAVRLESQYWKNPKSLNGYRRLSKLARDGWIERLREETCVDLHYRLTEKGERLLIRLGLKAKTSSPRARYSSSFLHDRKMDEIQRLIENERGVRAYFSERTLKSNLSQSQTEHGARTLPYKVPDAIAEVETPKGLLRIAIELERSLKSRRRYQKIFQDYANSSEFDRILYLFERDSDLQNFRRLFLGLAANDPHALVLSQTKEIYLGGLEAFMRHTLHLHVCRVRGEEGASRPLNQFISGSPVAGEEA